MAWTTPKTWAVGEALTASDLNIHLRDNLDALKDPPGGNYECDELADYTTTSTSFTDVDGTNLALTFTTAGGDVLVGFTGTINEAGANQKIYLNIAVDGVDVVGDDGFCIVYGNIQQVSFAYLITGVDADLHTFSLRWRVETGGSAVMYAGSGGSGLDIHPQFWAREI